MVAGIWFMIAAVWVVIGTRQQVELAHARLWRDERELAETYEAITDLVSDIPRWRPIRRRQGRRDIEAVVSDDADLLARYRELQKEQSAWNYLEGAAALAIGASLYQLIVPSAIRWRSPI